MNDYNVMDARLIIRVSKQSLAFAMADAMYTGEKPTLIMDDPFVNLDDRKLQGAEKLLKEAGEDYQIIYLTCRDERRF